MTKSTRKYLTEVWALILWVQQEDVFAWEACAITGANKDLFYSLLREASFLGGFGMSHEDIGLLAAQIAYEKAGL